MLNKPKKNKTQYIYIQVIFLNKYSGTSDGFISGQVHTTYFKFKLNEYNQFKIKMCITTSDSECKEYSGSYTRVDINFRDFYNMLKNKNVYEILQVYEFQLDKNINKKDIDNEILKYKVENNITYLENHISDFFKEII